MLDAVVLILDHTGGGREAVDRDAALRSLVIHQLIVVGEAARGLSPATRARHPGSPWRRIADMRNVLVHGYFAIDLDIVWAVVENELPKLRHELERMLVEMRRETPPSP